MRILLIILFFTLPVFSFASVYTLADTTLREESYLKYDTSLSSEENKEQSINLTFLNSLENAFGRIIASSNNLTISNTIESKNNAISNTSFKSRTKSLVQGKILKVIELFYEKRVSEKYIVINGDRVKTNTVFNFVRVEYIATEANQPIAFEQEMGNIQKQIDLISEKVEQNSKDISTVKENVEDLNKSGGRIINAATYKEISFNILNQLTPNIKKEELIFDLINRFSDDSKKMLSINSPGSESFNILYSFINEYGGAYSITLPKTIEVLYPLLNKIEESSNSEIYALYLYRKLTILVEYAALTQQGAEVSHEDFIKLKEIGDKIISKISKRDELDLLLRYHYYSLLMGYNNSGNMRRIIMLNIKTSIGFEDELLNIYSKLLSKKDFPYKDRIIEQINRGEESIIVQGLFKKEDDKYGITTKNNLHNSSIALIDYLYFDDLIYQESLSYMTYSYIYILKNMVDNYKKQQEGGMNYIVKFCVKL